MKGSVPECLKRLSSDRAFYNSAAAATAATPQFPSLRFKRFDPAAPLVGIEDDVLVGVLVHCPNVARGSLDLTLPSDEQKLIDGLAADAAATTDGSVAVALLSK